MAHGGSFRGKLFKWAGAGGWHFVQLPDRLSPPVTHAWGRTPVDAVVNGHAWTTSVWRGKDGRTLLAVPTKVREAKGDGDMVKVSLTFRAL